MKKTAFRPKKMTLDRQTIRNLQDTQLRGVAGALISTRLTIRPADCIDYQDPSSACATC